MKKVKRIKKGAWFLISYMQVLRLNNGDYICTYIFFLVFWTHHAACGNFPHLGWNSTSAFEAQNLTTGLLGKSKDENFINL